MVVGGFRGHLLIEVPLLCPQPMEVQEGYGFGSGERVCFAKGGRACQLPGARFPSTHSPFVYFEQMILILVQSLMFLA